MTQWAVFIVGEDASSQAFGPYRSHEAAEKVWRKLHQRADNSSMLFMETLDRATSDELEKWLEDDSMTDEEYIEHFV